MNIHDFLRKIKSWLSTETAETTLLIGVLLLVGLTSFGLGRLSKAADSSGDVIITNAIPFPSQETMAEITESSEAGVVYASKSGTRYYYPYCKSQVKEENKIWFSSVSEALGAGLTLASGCK